MSWKSTLTGIIIGAFFVTFFYITSWKGIAGFCLGIATTYLIMTTFYKEYLNVILKFLRKI
jgi:hypothetical protein